MTHSPRSVRSPVSGFSLIEALAAVFLMGLILSALGAVTAQWLPNWNRGFKRVEGSELAGIAIERLVGDLRSAEYVTPNRAVSQPLFVGTERSVTLVRTELGPNTGSGLEVVRIEEIADKQGPLVVRSQAQFAPLPLAVMSVDQLSYSAPVILLRAPLRATFAYSGADGQWRDRWQGQNMLPTAVRVAVRDSKTDRTLALSTVAMVRVQIPPPAPNQTDTAAPPTNPGAAQGG